jgi:hypothetical protein
MRGVMSRAALVTLRQGRRAAPTDGSEAASWLVERWSGDTTIAKVMSGEPERLFSG